MWNGKCNIEVMFCLLAVYDSVLKLEYRSRTPSGDKFFVHLTISKHNIRFKFFMFIMLM